MSTVLTFLPSYLAVPPGSSIVCAEIIIDCFVCILCFRIHPRDKQDVAHRLTLGARAVAYNEKDVHFLGPFPSQIVSIDMYVNITYDQNVSVTPSKDVFEVRLPAVKSHFHTELLF